MNDSLTQHGAERLAEMIRGYWAGALRPPKVRVDAIEHNPRPDRQKSEMIYVVRSDMVNGQPNRT